MRAEALTSLIMAQFLRANVYQKAKNALASAFSVQAFAPVVA